MILQKKISKTGLTLYQTCCLYLVPPRRIELRIDPYHGSVIPLNYGGNVSNYTCISRFNQ